MLTEGKGEDEELDEEESEKEVELVKKKGRVIITKPQQPTIVFSRRTRRGKKEIISSKPPLTFEERLKQMDEGLGMSNFKSLKFETRTDAKKM